MPSKAQTPIDPIAREFIDDHRRRWTDQHRAQATSCLNRWSRFLASQGVDTVADATPEQCRQYLDARCGVLDAAECARLGVSPVKGSTAHKDYQFMVWLYTWAIEDGAIEAPRGRDRGPMHRIKPPAISDPDPERTRYLSAEDYAKFMTGWQFSKLVDARNAAMCSLMYRTGLRCSEVARIDRDRLDLKSDAPYFMVEGKGRNNEPKWRRVPVSMETATLLGRYLRRLGPPLTDNDPLFVNTYNGTRESATHVRIKPQAIHDMLERRSKRLGMHVTSHMMRRAFAIEARRTLGLDDVDIIAIAGWVDTRMLARYTREEGQSMACDAFHKADTTNARPAHRRRNPRRAA